jgi:hypothetical protein
MRVHQVVEGRVGGSDAISDHTEADAGLSAVDEIEQLLLDLFRDIEKELGALKGTGEAEAFDQLVLLIGLDCDLCSLDLSMTSGRRRSSK